MIDFHSHVLPGMDDGSASLEESIAMLRMEAEQGITQVVATPHFYPRYDRPEVFLDKRARSEELLRREMAKYSDLPQLSVGAEVYFFRGISESKILNLLTIQGKSCIMIEMMGSPWPQYTYDELLQIYRRWNLTPIIAHIDRYIAPFRSHGIPDALAQLPVMVQANASFFLKKGTQRLAMALLRDDKIQLLGSDCHNLSDRCPNLGQARQVIAQRLGEEVLSRVHTYGSGLLRK